MMNKEQLQKRLTEVSKRLWKLAEWHALAMCSIKWSDNEKRNWERLASQGKRSGMNAVKNHGEYIRLNKEEDELKKKLGVK